MEEIELLRPWVPVDQDDMLDDLTEAGIEQHIQTLRTQISHTQDILRSRGHRVKQEMEMGDLAAEVADELAEAEAPLDVVQQANQVLQQGEERTITDLREELHEANALSRLREELRYSQAWLTACNYLRRLERAGLQHLADGIDQFTAVAATAASQLVISPAGGATLSLPPGTQEFDLHYVQEQTLKIGKQLLKETKEFRVRLLDTPDRIEEQPNIVLKAAFKIAQFAYYAYTLAHTLGGALSQAFAHLRMVLDHFLPMVSGAIKAIVQ